MTLILIIKLWLIFNAAIFARLLYLHAPPVEHHQSREANQLR